MTRVPRSRTSSDRSGRRSAGAGLLACLVAVAIASGCAQQQQLEAKDVLVAQLFMADVNKADVMEAAENVLSSMRFVIEKSDMDAGLLRTVPLSGAQFFELWRSDNAGGFNAVESNLHSLRRTVELNVNKEASGQIRVDCRVQTERLDIPEQYVTGSGRAYFLFSRSNSSMQKIQLNPEQEAKMAWVDMGRDDRLERRILSRIEDHVATRAQTAPSGTAKKPETTGRKS